jgi:hypothetical protein
MAPVDMYQSEAVGVQRELVPSAAPGQVGRQKFSVQVRAGLFDLYRRLYKEKPNHVDHFFVPMKLCPDELKRVNV